VILPDIAHQNQDGLDGCRQLRSDLCVSDVPGLLLGQTDVATERALFNTGADDLVAKPFVPDELLVHLDAPVSSRQAI
jgi:DNA-binding response OmpR family regulator